MKRRRIAAALVLLLAAVPVRAQAPPDFTALVERYGAAVVNISSTQRLTRPPPPDASGEHPLDEMLRRYFKDWPEHYDETSLGSGVIISSDGFILTCAHVVEEAHEVVVRLTDRREFRARLIGADSRSDVALLKIDAQELPTVVFGDPGRLKVGEWVLAIGSPFGFDNSATTGVVSAKGRSLPHESYIPFLQTDVAINPGNSGGPLFNLRGEVVGINSQIYSRTGGFMGVSFAVPIDLALRVAEQLKTEGRVRRGWLGVSVQEVSRALAEAYGLDQPRGALIADILPGGPAAGSALRPGDVVLEYEGQRILRSTDLPPLVGKTAPGTSARLGILRRGQGAQTIQVSIGELKEARAQRPEARRPVLTRGLGLVVDEITAEERRVRGLDYGILVEGVEDGAGREAGLRVGDVILEVDGTRVGSVAEFHRLIARAPRGGYAVLRIRRGASSLFLAVRR